MRHHSFDPDRRNASGNELARAQQDYRRLRSAYLELTRLDPDNEVALAMTGADMDRAETALQHLAGQQLLPMANEIPAIRVPSRRMADVAS